MLLSKLCVCVCNDCVLSKNYEYPWANKWIIVDMLNSIDKQVLINSSLFGLLGISIVDLYGTSPLIPDY